MRIVSTIAAMQRLGRQWQTTETPVAFVPTMGYLHAGHLGLIQRARQATGHKGQVVVSIYVNPTQFAPHEDLAKYPHNLSRDKRLCQQHGVDIVFVPTDKEMYPEGFSTQVVEKQLSVGMEGGARPTHFAGVTTVVAKLFNVVLPNVAIFGAKDFQQAAIVQQMVRDLNFPIKIIVNPTTREPDGLALSSRNKYLSAKERKQATVLFRALQFARSTAAKGPLSADQLKKEAGKLIAGEAAARLDYMEFFDPKTLEPAKEVKLGTHMALAVFIGKTRLIDNAKL